MRVERIIFQSPFEHFSLVIFIEASAVFPLPLGEGLGEGLAATPMLTFSFFLFWATPTVEESTRCFVWN